MWATTSRPVPKVSGDGDGGGVGFWLIDAATNTPSGQLGWLETRHRTDARVDDRIRYGNDIGQGQLTSRHFNINCVWLELALATDLIAWT